MHPLVHTIPLYNIDSSKNKAGNITCFVHLWLWVGEVEGWWEFLVIELGLENIMLGLPWLRSANSAIDWMKGTVKLDYRRSDLKHFKRSEQVEQLAANQMQRCWWWKAKLLNDLSEQLWCAVGYAYFTELAEKTDESERKWIFKEILPEEYCWYAKIFSETESEHLSKHKPYDHMIELKSDTPETIWFKIYPMLINEQEKLDHFLEEDLHKGYILPLKSSIALPVFFIKKKTDNCN